jgi:hypothetical protein
MVFCSSFHKRRPTLFTQISNVLRSAKQEAHHDTFARNSFISAHCAAPSLHKSFCIETFFFVFWRLPSCRKDKLCYESSSYMSAPAPWSSLRQSRPAVPPCPASSPSPMDCARSALAAHEGLPETGLWGAMKARGLLAKVEVPMECRVFPELLKSHEAGRSLTVIINLVSKKVLC